MRGREHDWCMSLHVRGEAGEVMTGTIRPGFNFYVKTVRLEPENARCACNRCEATVTGIFVDGKHLGLPEIQVREFIKKDEKMDINFFVLKGEDLELEVRFDTAGMVAVEFFGQAEFF